jgi:sorting nexin-1/2
LKKTNTKKLEATEDLGNMEEGKTTIRTVFKSKEDTTAMRVHIESTEREIDNLSILCDIVTIHLGKDVIPAFKKNKLKIYRQMIKSLGKIEIQNAHAIATMWSLVDQSP